LVTNRFNKEQLNFCDKKLSVKQLNDKKKVGTPSGLRQHGIRERQYHQSRIPQLTGTLSFGRVLRDNDYNGNDSQSQL